MGSCLRRTILNTSIKSINNHCNLSKIKPLHGNSLNFSSVAESFEGHGILGTYAKALYNVSNNAKKTDKVLEDFKLLNSIYKDSPEFQNFIANPSLDKDVKLKFLNEQLKFDDITLSCICLMFENKRMDNLSNFVNILEKIHFKNQGKALSQENREKIKAAISKRLKSNEEPIIEFIESPEIIGGLVTKIDGKVIDSSVAGKLNSINNILNS